MTARGEGSGAAREGSALLQGLLRCGRCGRKMQVAYSGTGGKVRRYACSRGRDMHATGKACQTVGGARLEKTVTGAFLEAAAPPGSRRPPARSASSKSSTSSGSWPSDSRSSARNTRPTARSGKYDAREPENRLVARTLERALEAALVDLERQRGPLAQLERARPLPLTNHEREERSRSSRGSCRGYGPPRRQPIVTARSCCAR